MSEMPIQTTCESSAIFLRRYAKIIKQLNDPNNYIVDDDLDDDDLDDNPPLLQLYQFMTYQIIEKFMGKELTDSERPQIDTILAYNILAKESIKDYDTTRIRDCVCDDGDDSNFVFDIAGMKDDLEWMEEHVKNFET